MGRTPLEPFLAQSIQTGLEDSPRRFLSLESPGPANAFRLSTNPWGLRRHSLAAEMMELCGARLGLTG